MQSQPARRVPTPASKLGIHLPDDRFIPLRSEDLIDALVEGAEGFGLSADKLRAVAEGLDRLVAQEIEPLRRRLERAYACCNPARDTLLLSDDRPATAQTRQLVAYVLDKANYEALDDVQVDAAMRAASSHGIRIRINPERVEWLELWVRGRTTAVRAVRTLRRPIRGEEHDVELYRRLALVFQARDEVNLNLKLFREIPVADVEALLPHAEVEMSLFDRVKVFGGSLGALGGVATKIFEGTVVATQFMWVAIAALLGLSVRSFLGYRRAKHTRLSQMTHHLYYQNVANNAGVLGQLVASIEHEELKEAVLAYALVYGDPEIDSMSALEQAARRWLAERFEVEVDFDGPDAVETLERFGLWEDREAWRLLAPGEAIEVLERGWQTRKTAEYHVTMAHKGSS